MFQWLIKIFSIRRHPHKDVLKKFKKGAVIENEEELKILKRYYSTGMVHFGFDYKLRSSTASLTKQGKWFLGNI